MSNMIRLAIVGAALCASNFVAQPHAVAAFGPETVAFYPFNEGAAGESAVGKVLSNAVDRAGFGVCTGYVETVGANASVTFSDETPGKYLFTDLASGPAAYTNAKSLYFTGGAAKMFIDQLCAKALALGKFKIEFWYKYDTSASAGKKPFVTFCGGWNTATMTNIWVWLETRSGFQDRVLGRTYTNSAGTRTEVEGSNKDSCPDVLRDGKWHHLAIVYPYINNNYICFVNDHYKTKGGSRLDISSYSAGGDVPRPFIFNDAGLFRGWISCLRMTDGGDEVFSDATAYKSLHPSNLETCLPKTLVHYRFEDGANGDGLASVIPSHSETYLSVNTQLYARAGVALGDSWDYPRGDGALRLSTDEDVATPTFTNDVKRKYVRSGTDESTRVTNALSANFVSPDASDSHVAGAGILLRKNAFFPLTQFDPYTVELFVKFDYADWKSRVGDVAGKGKRVALAWNTHGEDTLLSSGSYLFNWELFIDLTDESKPKIAIFGRDKKGVSLNAAAILDGRWHHVAVAIDPSAYPQTTASADVSLYFDGEGGTSESGTIYFYKMATSYTITSLRNFWFMRGDRQHDSYSHAFNGLVDEIRISHGLLSPSEFLVQKGDPGSIVIVQ